MRTARKAHHLRKKPYIRHRRVSVKTPLQKGGGENYTTYKTDTDGYIQKTDGSYIKVYKEADPEYVQENDGSYIKLYKDDDPDDRVKCVLM